MSNTGVEKIDPGRMIRKGLWIGGRRGSRKSLGRHEEHKSLGDTSYDTSCDGITKRFIEPDYDEVSQIPVRDYVVEGKLIELASESSEGRAYCSL